MPVDFIGIFKLLTADADIERLRALSGSRPHA
jgi:hypothetical protein